MRRTTFACWATIAVAGSTLTHVALAASSGAGLTDQPRLGPSTSSPTHLGLRGSPQDCDPGNSTIITENVQYNYIEVGTSISCGTNDGTFGHSYGRYHDMSDFSNGVDDLSLVCVHWGLESSSHALAVDVNIYRDVDGTPVPDSSPGDLVLLATSSGILSVGSTFYHTSDFESEWGGSLGANDLIFVELVVADGSTPNEFGKPADHFVGTNGLGQLSESWIRTTDGYCGLGSWTTMTTIGYPDLHFVEYMEVREEAPTDPCEDPLPKICSSDVWGPDDAPDGQVNVSDLLKVISDWNQTGDGTSRPIADCAPLPIGDCTVDVTDLLKVIGDWGGECGPPPSGACCITPGNCLDGVAESDCTDGTWTLGQTCSDLGCDIVELDLALNEIRTNQPDADNDEYVEIVGDPGTSLDDYTYIIIGDNNTDGDHGIIEEALLLTGHSIPSSGYFLIGEDTLTLATPDLVIPVNHENSDQATYMLVRGFTGFIDDDLDTDDDGTLDITPWLLVKDSVAFIGPDPSMDNAVYSSTLVGPDGIYVPGHVIRCGDSSWNVGCFDLLADTPGAANNCADGDSDGDGISDTCDNCPNLANEDQSDCDGDGTGDACAIADGIVPDCNGNNIPDNCETDCNGNGVPDDCDIADGAGDCDGNGIMDDCEEDCNNNGNADPCDIIDGISLDDNGNGVPDECETPVFVINEINADPSSNPDGTYADGDANGDGEGHYGDDEFVELVNYSGDAIDMGNWTLADATGTRHVFPIGTVLEDQCSMILFGGGTPTGDFGGALVQTASTGYIGLNNGGDTITIADETGVAVLSVTYGSEGEHNQSITLVPDVYGTVYFKHSEVAPDGSLFSPGYRIDGSPLGTCDPPIDTDGDGVPDSVDNCDLPNPDQDDCDGDGIGDVCELADGTQTDDDGNGIPDDCEGDIPTTLWINEFHYDNSSTDVNEFVEVVLLDEVDPNQVTLTLYNGSNGSTYGSFSVGTEFIPGESGAGWTVYSLAISGVQNGAPDGLCLDLGGQVAHFISYEGTLTATAGPASGLTSTDVGVAEGNTTTANSSLGLTGTGGAASDFTWTTLVDLASAGSSNDGQVIVIP